LAGRASAIIRRLGLFFLSSRVEFGAFYDVAPSAFVSLVGAAVNCGVAVGDAAVSSCVGFGNSLALGVATIGAPIVAGQVSRVGLCAKNRATREVIAAAIETIPNAIVQRARR